MSDKAKWEAEKAKRQAQTHYESAERARQLARQEEEERRKAQSQAYHAEKASEDAKMTYKTLFIGNMIFTVILAFFVAYGKRGVLREMIHWFSSRWDNIKTVFSWFAGLYMGAVKLMGVHWKLGAGWCYIIATLVAIAVFIGLLWFLGVVLYKIFEVIEDIYSESQFDSLFKGLVQVDITLAMLYVCLFFNEGIKKVLPLNIFSVWLILSFIGWIVWNGIELKTIIERKLT